MIARPYTPADADAWNDLVARSWNGTFLHTRPYLAETAGDSEDRSLVVEDDRRMLAVFPAAVHASDTSMIESHPVLGYGGLVHTGALRGERMLAALEAVAERYYHDGLRTLRYKAVPHIYHRVPSADDLYALYRLGAVRSRCDLASVVDIAQRETPSKRRGRSLKKAQRAGVYVERGAEWLEGVWAVVSERLETKYETAPLHSLAQLEGLTRVFGDAIEYVSGLVGSDVVAGVVVFRAGPVEHAQYIAADARGYAVSALDPVLESCLAEASRRGARYFSLGNSTLYGGRVFNEGLFRFKAEFGAGTEVHETYDIALV